MSRCEQDSWQRDRGGAAARASQLSQDGLQLWCGRWCCGVLLGFGATCPTVIVTVIFV
jgi:hypothetical protein